MRLGLRIDIMNPRMGPSITVYVWEILLVFKSIFIRNLYVLGVLVAIGFAIGTEVLATPPVVTDLVLDLSAGVGVTADTGGLISEWADQSPLGNSVVQATVDNQPLLLSGVVNGSATFNAVRFDGANDLLSRTTELADMPTSATGGTVFLAYRATATSDVFQNVYGITATSTGNNDRISSGLGVGTSWSTRTRTAAAGSAASTSSISSADAGGAPLSDVFYVQAAVWDTSQAAATQFSKLLLPNGSIITGSDSGSFVSPPFTPAFLNVGMLFTAPTAGTTFQGDLAELLVYKVGLGETEIGSVFQYLGTKYGVLGAPAAVPGDFNLNGAVDAADYVLWRKNLGTSFDLNGNGDETGGSAGVVDDADYALWRSAFGNPPGSGATLETTNVPEPATAALIATILGAALAVTRNRR
jgi:hypothetical protein